MTRKLGRRSQRRLYTLTYRCVKGLFTSLGYDIFRPSQSLQVRFVALIVFQASGKTMQFPSKCLNAVDFLDCADSVPVDKAKKVAHLEKVVHGVRFSPHPPRSVKYSRYQPPSNQRFLSRRVSLPPIRFSQDCQTEQ